MSNYIKNIRKKIGNDMLFIPGTSCIIKNKQGQILLEQRSDGGKWGCPGGLMDVGEVCLESMKREVLEETGLNIYNPKLFGIYSGERYQGVYENGDKIQTLLIVFLTDVYSGNIKASEESLKMDFFDLEKIPENIGEHHYEYIRDYIRYCRGEIEIPVIS